MKLYDEMERLFPIFEKRLSEEELSALKDASISEPFSYQFDLRRWIQKLLLHPDESDLYGLFFKNGIKSSEEMSSFILQFFHYYIITKESPRP